MGASLTDTLSRNIVKTLFANEDISTCTIHTGRTFVSSRVEVERDSSLSALTCLSGYVDIPFPIHEPMYRVAGWRSASGEM